MMRHPMSVSESWRRVDRANACPVCGKPDWCLFAPDGSAAICARVAEGAVKRCGEAGWLHRLQDRAGWGPARRQRFVVRATAPAALRPEMARLAERYRAAVDPGRLGRLSLDLGVSTASLHRLGLGWCGASRAWSFPMVDPRGRVLGIRLRTDGGRKFAVTGSREGLFLPAGPATGGPLLVCEGPTDTAAALDLGLDVVGRASCMGGGALLATLAGQLRPPEIVIVADQDGPGIAGGHALARRIAVDVARLRVITPPPGIKDLRAWGRAGADLASVLDAIRAASTHRVSVAVRSAHSKAGPAEVWRGR